MVSGYNAASFLADLRQLISTPSDAEFDKLFGSIYHEMTKASKCVEPVVDSTAWEEFCVEVQGADKSHMAQHPEYHDDAEALGVLGKIALSLPATEDDLKAIEEVDSVKISTPGGTWVPKMPNGEAANKVDLMVTIPGEPRVQRAHCLDADKCVVMRRAGDTLSFVTEEPSPHTSSTMSYTLWCTKSDDGEFKIVRPGTACFTGIPVASKFNVFFAMNKYFQEFADEESLVRPRGELRKSLQTWLESEGVKDNQIWALQSN